MGLNKRLFLSKKDLQEALQRPSSWVLIAVNLGLIIGVVAWDWQVFDIVFLYWVENLVIGAINVLKMIAAKPGTDPLSSLVDEISTDSNPQKIRQIRASIAKSGIGNFSNAFKLFLIPFFIIHYGMFCYGHGVFVFSMFGDLSTNNNAGESALAAELLSGGMLLAIGLLAASHLFSFFRNFLGDGEYKRTHAASLMMRPYGRIVALHITIIFGAFLTMAFGSPLGLLVILMVLKTLVDLAMHQSERIKFKDLTKPV